MTAKCALIAAFLEGRVLNVKNCFQTIGLTNCARETSRMVERPFGVMVTRTRREGVSRYGQSVSWVDYKFNPLIKENREGVKKMIEYVKKHSGEPKTQRDLNLNKKLKQLELL